MAPVDKGSPLVDPDRRVFADDRLDDPLEVPASGKQAVGKISFPAAPSSTNVGANRLRLGFCVVTTHAQTIPPPAPRDYLLVFAPAMTSGERQSQPFASRSESAFTIASTRTSRIYFPFAGVAFVGSPVAPTFVSSLNSHFTSRYFGSWGTTPTAFEGLHSSGKSSRQIEVSPSPA